jgi:hypothetical protein
MTYRVVSRNIGVLTLHNSLSAAIRAAKSRHGRRLGAFVERMDFEDFSATEREALASFKTISRAWASPDAEAP